jgi:hypothetical protein
MENKKGQGESLIKLLVVAIIAIIAIALAKSYFRESARVTQRTVEEVFNPAGAMISDAWLQPFAKSLTTSTFTQDET